MDIAAIGSLLGGLGQAAGGLGGLFGGGRQDMTAVNQSFAQNQFNANMELQREFAKNGIRWRVEDAKAAGLHPLAALGAAGAAYTPSTSIVGDTGYSSDRDIGSSLSNMGQGIGRAVAATQSKQERVLSAYELKRQEQDLTRGDLENQILASKLAIANTSVGPGMPGVAGVAPGTSPEVQILGTTTGGFTTHPSKASKAEDEFGAPLMAETLYRNRLLPMLGAAPPQPIIEAVRQKYPGATGAYWDYVRMDWQPTYHPSGEGALRRYTSARRNYSYRGSAPSGSAAPYLAP